MKLFRLLPISASLLLLLASCGAGEEKYTEQTELEKAEIEAAMMQGRNAARDFVNREWKDTIELMRNLLEVRATHSQYSSGRNPRQAEAFDSGFISTVRAVDPRMAESITARPEQKKP